MHKIMIASICLGILLVGIVMVPSAFAATAFIVSHAQESYLRGCEETAQGCFIPSLKTIHVGDTVIWENYDTSDHNIASGSPLGNVGLIFDSQIMNPNTSFSHTFDAVGTYDYFCMIHPWMTGTVVVETGADTEPTYYIGEEVAEPEPTPEPAAEPKSESTQTSTGCGEGTVLVDGVCQLAPQESSDGCGQGTELVNGMCQLAKATPFYYQTPYVVAGAAIIGAAIIGIIFAVKRGSGGTSTPKPARQDLEEYEEQYLARQGQRPSPKPAEPRQTSSFCDSCGVKLKPTAKFCGKCGTPRS
jgi:plastocyanin